ncbi:hypothetical protein QJ854_gp221 [Moumouvirus goulette]|uniref:Uncharacterized protein n=1 Tax=Moumouvirus goulette TaxID=1247379 RepID=M1PNH6_9VIRU|nr:hypothetical protein QJ854_gp221 [Moumouvirus goulette]AGF85561.1 hypothetical protein glt_00756 [Moumouvirus goulette]
MSVIFKNSTDKKTLFSILNGNKTKDSNTLNKSVKNIEQTYSVPDNNYITRLNNQTDSKSNDKYINNTNDIKYNNTNDDRRSFINFTTGITSNTKTHNKNSLAFITELIRQKITERCTLKNKFLDADDNEVLKRVHKKFEEKQNDWNLMMDFILKYMTILDEKYIQFNHLDIKDLIQDKILNISFSYIILDNSISFKQNIIEYIKSLNTYMLEIHQSKIKLSKLNLQISKYQNIKRDNLKNIANCEQKIKSSDITHSETINNKKNIEIYKKSIEEAESILKTFNKNKESYHQIILDNIYFINTNLIFNSVSGYFMHDDWIPYLDNNIFPSAKTVI